MKPKPTSHRSSNTFKFQGFHQKIKNIKVSSRIFLLKKPTSDDESVTQFWQSIIKWRELNLTAGFKEFQKDIGSECHSVAQLLLNEIHIARAFETHLIKVDVAAQPPILHALVAFASDIPTIFYEKYFVSSMKKLISILDTRCHETIENIFVCFVSIFTSLQKYMKKDMYKVFIDTEFSALFSKKYPWHINELAAQSICGLIRKINSKKEFFTVVFKLLAKVEYEPFRMGKLLFHCLKSDVARRLHSSASSTFEIFLDLLDNEDLPLENSCSSISSCLENLSFYVTAANASISLTWQETWQQDACLIWPVFYRKLKLFSENCSLSSERKLLVLKSYLQLILTVVQFKHGALTYNESELMDSIFIATKHLKNDEIGKLVAEVTSSIFFSPHIDKSTKFLNFVLTKLLECNFSCDIVFNFIMQTVHSDIFDAEILPFALEYISRSSLHHSNEIQILNCLGTIVCGRQSLIKTGADLQDLITYSLDFSKASLKSDKRNKNHVKSPILDIFYMVIKKGLTLNFDDEFEALLLACLCLPNVKPLQLKDFIVDLFSILNDALEQLDEDAETLIPDWSNDIIIPKKKKKAKPNTSLCPLLNFNVKQNFNEKSKKILFLIGVLVESLYRLLSLEEFISTCKESKLMSLMLNKLQYRENVDALRSLDIYLSAAAMKGDDNIINENMLQTLYVVLAPCLSSNQHSTRLLVTHIFQLFPVELPPINLNAIEHRSMFCIMFEAECSPITPHNYKDRLRILSYLDSEYVSSSKPLSGVYDHAPLLFLIGQLYINFKELYETIIKYISKYAYSLRENEFWSVWLSKLKIASFMSLNYLCDKTKQDEIDINFENSILNDMHHLLDIHPGLSLLSTRTDYLNYRDLLWQCMQHFPDVCERRSYDVVTLFFHFLYKELFPADFNVAPTQDISKFEDEDVVESANIKCSEEADDPVTPNNSELLDANQRTRKAPAKSLCEILSVFTKFRNPKAVHKAKELETIYYEFLSHPNLRIQKLALDALMAYNYKFLCPYSESLYKILDDKTFRDEITLFNIDGEGDDESKSLKAEHRDHFMPILMRILYGKMQCKTGGHTAGKSKIGVRKSIVLRFLAGASESELDTFLNLAFDVLMQYIEGSAIDIVTKVQGSINPQKVVPLKRLLGALGTLEIVFEKIGGLLDTKRSFMLKVILFILCTVVNLLERKDEVCTHFYPLLKSIRHLAMQKLVLFFTNFEHYEWTSDEIDAVFSAAVWPSLQRLSFEGIYSPTPLFSLLGCWAENPRYHILLAKHHLEDRNLTPMPFIINLINHHKCSAKVIDAAYNMIEKLLNKETADMINSMDDDFNAIIVNNVLYNEPSDLEFGHLNVGETLVLLNRDDLLENLKHKLLALGKGQMVNNRDLTILIRLSEWIKRKEIGQDLLEFIVPLLKKNCIKQTEKVAYLLDTCSRLIKIVENSEQFINDFLCMFSTLKGRIARASLCQAVEAVASKIPSYKQLSGWCMNLNAWNLKMVEEIDYEIRLSCYNEANKYMSESSFLDEHIGLFLIHHNVWVLKEIEDLGLKNLSNNCLHNLIEMFVRVKDSQLELCRKLIEQNLLPLSKIGIRNKSENVRNSFVNVLRFAVHKCHSFIPRLKDFLQVSNLNDPEMDFLTNMSHIQRSRRTRAMARLVDQLVEIPIDGTVAPKKSLKFQTDTITDFLLPIVSSFLFKEEYSSDDNLLNASAQCVGALAKELPWYPYKNLLKHYLSTFSSELKQLKLGVKVLEAIMDAFHEDVCDPSSFPSEEDDDDSIPLLLKTKRAKAQKVFTVLTKEIIPKIRKTLSERSRRDTEHKVNKKKYPEDEDIKRIPLALALVKLLKKLPKRILDANVNNVLLRLISYLQSKSIFIRREARLMLVKVLKELGGEYLFCLIKDLNTILSRGFQSHVMVFTIHAVLTDLQIVLTASHIDPCVSDIMDICIEDLFGDKAEEKEVSKITNKVTEARAEKGYSIMGIVAQTISVTNLECVMIPLKELLNTHNNKIVSKVSNCFQKIANGLDRNSNISVQHKSIFIYGILKDKIKELSKDSLAKKGTGDKLIKKHPTDSFLLAPEPKKIGLIPKSSLKTTSHALVEFALSLLHILLKHEHFTLSDNVHCGLLDSYVSIMHDCLSSDYQQVSIYALNVLLFLIKFPLPSFNTNISKICGQIFIILNKFASAGLTKGKLFELVQLCFKSIACIIKEVHFYELEQEHVRVLLHYARNNLDDHNQHHSTFTILEAIISRKIQAPELHDLMVIIREMSIISSNLNMLDQARCTYLKYMMNYPKNQKQHVASLQFYLNNVSFDIPAGRMSASLMINDLISKYPRTLFDKSTEVNIWFQLAEQLLKEELSEHRLLLQRTLKELYKKSDRKRMLLTKCLLLMNDNPDKSKAENALIVHMSALSLHSFLENSAAEQPAIMFSKVIPEIVSLLHPGRYKLDCEVDDKQNEKAFDLLDVTLDSLLVVMTKIMDIYMTKENLQKWDCAVGNDFWKYIQEHMLYPNLKVRLHSVSLFGKLFGFFPVEEETTPKVAMNSKQVCSLILDFCEVLNTESPIETPLLSHLGMAVVRCLIYLIRQGKKVPIKLSSIGQNNIHAEEAEDAQNFHQSDDFIKGAYAVLHRVGVMAYDELRKKSKKSTLRRECLLNLIAGVVQILDLEFKKCDSIISFVMKHLIRELSDEHLPESLSTRTKEVASFVREKLGPVIYNEEMLRVQLALERKRNKRKATEKELIVSNPEIAMNKKSKKQIAKKQSKKRRFTELKLKPNKKRRLRDFAMIAS